MGEDLIGPKPSAPCNVLNFQFQLFTPYPPPPFYQINQSMCVMFEVHYRGLQGYLSVLQRHHGAQAPLAQGQRPRPVAAHRHGTFQNIYSIRPVAAHQHGTFHNKCRYNTSGGSSPRNFPEYKFFFKVLKNGWETCLPIGYFLSTLKITHFFISKMFAE